MMSSAELLKKVRKIEIKTKGLTNQVFSGQYHSAFKGRGMAFSEVREYLPGDDVRTIDWNVTARFNSPYVKVYEEERELTVMLLVDVSSSGMYGSGESLKQDIITELCAIISFSAIQNNDKIGVLFFSDKIEKFIPPQKGKQHILRIIRELINLKPSGKQTNISLALKYFINVIKKRSIAFLLSDFMDKNFENDMKIASKKHDIVALRIYDKREVEIPDVGLIKVKDVETGQIKWIDTASKSNRNIFYSYMRKYEKDMQDIFNRSGVDMANIDINVSYVVPLKSLFKKREKF